MRFRDAARTRTLTPALPPPCRPRTTTRPVNLALASCSLLATLGALTAGHIALNHDGFTAFAHRLSVGSIARGELIVGHLPVT
jgi:hypothetical protein